MERILGIDLGEARIGLALSDELGMFAHPFETIVLKTVTDPVARIVEVTRAQKTSRVILGLPRNMNGTYGPAADKAREFATKLEAAGAGKVVLWDERLTTVQAQKALQASGRKTKESRPVIDQVAAQFILQSYLDSAAMMGG